MTPTPDVNALIERLEALDAAATDGPWVVYSEPEVGLPASLFSGRIGHEGFGPIEPLTGVDLDIVAEARNALPVLFAHLRTLQARVGELTEVVTWLAERPTIEEVMNRGPSVVSLEERIRMMGERKLEHDEMVQRARTLTSQEAQRHGE